MSPPIRAEELLLRCKGVVDPFNRMGCNVEPTVIVTEFCQFQGPRPLATVSLKSDNVLTSIDIDSLSLWLMSSDVTSGTILNIYNQQMGIYALSYYTIIYDMRARAFQRPMCVALLTSKRPTYSQLTRFSNGVRKLVSPLLKCNRRFFLRQLTDFIKISDAVDSQTVQSYYTLDIELLKKSASSRKFMNVAEQARKVRPRVQAMYDKLSDSCTCVKCDGHMEEDLSAAEEIFISFLQTSTLSPISDLAPCVYDSFMVNLHSFLSDCNAENQLRQGVLYCANTPILSLPKRCSSAKINTSNSDEYVFSGNEETLRMVSQHLDNLLFPVLTGADMVVCGSKQRKGTVIDFVEKINLLKPKSHPNHDVVLWTKIQNRPKGVIGVCLNRNESAALNLPGIAVLDTNFSVLHAIPYQGVLLANLRQKRRFPSDAALLSFIAAVLTNISSLVYISRYLSPLHMDTENISVDDKRILVNLLTELDLIKYQGLKSALEKMQSRDVLTKVIQL